LIQTVVLSTPRAVSTAVADFLTRAVGSTPGLVLGLPAGGTPIPLYRALVDRYRAGRIDFSRVATFNLDEFCGLAPDDPRTYRAFMRTHLFDHVNIPLERAHLLDGAARRWREEIAQFETKLAALGGLDLAIVGIGNNGHIAFNEPGPALIARTHRVRLTPATRRANAEAFGNRWRAVPTHGLTMGMGTIASARGVVLIATGAHKATIVRRALTGMVTPQVPASLLQLHPNLVVTLDRAAAAKL